jgi:NAD(P)-dependent dehydrogenase (short-subunit alcohol dehydrogenase family)
MTDDMKSALADRVVLITGGGWNIGSAVARHLAGLGASVAITGRRRDVLDRTCARIAADGGRCLAVPADLLDADQAERAVATTERELGPVFALAALAGGIGAQQPLDLADPSDWWHTFESNVRTAFHSVRAVLPGFRERGGHVVFCSGGGAYVPLPGQHLTAYASAKAALCRLTDQLQAEVWDLPIHVNCIDPGAVLDEPEQLQALADLERRAGHEHPIRKELRRGSESGELIAWLLTEAAGHVRGRLIATCDDWWRDRQKAEAVVGTWAYRMKRWTL